MESTDGLTRDGPSPRSSTPCWKKPWDVSSQCSGDHWLLDQLFPEDPRDPSTKPILTSSHSEEILKQGSRLTSAPYLKGGEFFGGKAELKDRLWFKNWVHNIAQEHLVGFLYLPVLERTREGNDLTGNERIWLLEKQPWSLGQNEWATWARRKLLWLVWPLRNIVTKVRTFSCYRQYLWSGARKRTVPRGCA